MKAIALCSCPRLGFMDFMGQSLVAFGANQIAVKHLYGAFWSQSMSNGIKQALEDGYDFILTCDYDSIFSADTVDRLMMTLIDNPEADAVCTMQMGRFSGLLISTENGKIRHKDLMTKDIVPVDTGHFGLTVFRASAFSGLKKPWFWSKPNSKKEWDSKTNKVDEDIYFWVNFQKSGKQLYLAPRCVIGHLELLIKWPALNLDGIYETTAHYHEFGPPADVWK